MTTKGITVGAWLDRPDSPGWWWAIEDGHRVMSLEIPNDRLLESWREAKGWKWQKADVPDPPKPPAPPAWHEKPTESGLWACDTQFRNGLYYLKVPGEIPYETGNYYGPIPPSLGLGR